MQKGGFELHGVLFNGALAVYNIVNEGLELLESKKRIYRIISRIEQYGCLVNFYSGAGWLEEVLHVIANMPMKPDEFVLELYRTQGDITLAKILIQNTFLRRILPEGVGARGVIQNTFLRRIYMLLSEAVAAPAMRE